jgi:hypothetical protein
MDLTKCLPTRNSIYSDDVSKMKLAFARQPFNVNSGKFVSAVLPNEQGAPAFLLKGLELPYNFSKFRTLALPAEDNEVSNIVARVAELVRRACKVNASEWFEKSENVVEAALDLKTGLREGKVGTTLSLKAPSNEQDPEFFDVTGDPVDADLNVRDGTCDVLVSFNGLFLRGLTVFIQWKVIAVSLTKVASNERKGLVRSFANFTIVE